MSIHTLVFPTGYNKTVTFRVTDVDAVDIFESGRRTRRTTKDAARKCYRQLVKTGFVAI